MAISRMNMERQMRNMGGIMSLEDQRQGYFLGKLVKKITKPIKKVVKSPLGKLALAAAAGYGLGGGTFFGKSLPFLKNTAGGFSLANLGANLGFGSIGPKGKFAFDGILSPLISKGGKFNLGRAALTGLGATAVAAPFFMGGEEEVDEESFTGPISSIEDIRSQAKAYYSDPTNSALYFMPPKSAVRSSFYAADGGLADIPREGYSSGNTVMGDIAMSEPSETFKGMGTNIMDILKSLPPSLLEIFMNMKDSDKSDILEKLQLPENLADGGIAGLRPGYRFGNIVQKAGQMMKAGVGKVKSLFDDADINLSIRDQDVMTDSGLQAQAVGMDVFITPKSKKSVRVMEELIEEGYNISKEADGSYSVSSLDEGPLDEIAKRLRLGGDDIDDFMKSYEDYQGGLRSTGSEEDMIYEALRQRKAEGGLMDLGGFEKDYREGGFVPLGAEERADDVPARLSKNEFVFTADAVRNAGEGDIDKGAEVMQNMMDNLEAGGTISEESQGKENPAQEMFDQAQHVGE